MAYDYRYKDSLFLNDLLTWTERSYRIDTYPQARVYENAVILPFKGMSPGMVVGYGGVVDSDGVYVRESAVEAEHIMDGPYDVADSEISKGAHRVVYLGYFLKQWGHFIVDFLPRVWWLLNHDKDALLVYLSKDANTLIDGNYRRLLELAGVQVENLVRLGCPTCYREVVVPELAMVRPDYWSDAYGDIVDAIVANVPEQRATPERMYFTRTKYRKAQASEIGEKEIERLFRANGFQVVSPERMSIDEQVWCLSHCNEFAALSGTIPHNVIFTRRQKASRPCRVTILNKTHRVNTIQCCLNDFADADVTYVDCNCSLLPVSPASGPFWVRVNDNLRRYADDRGWIIPVRHLPHVRDRHDYLRYCLLYAKTVRDPSLDLDGSIVGSSRPLKEGATVVPTWFHYREQLGDLLTFTTPAECAKACIKRCPSIH